MCCSKSAQMNEDGDPAEPNNFDLLPASLQTAYTLSLSLITSIYNLEQSQGLSLDCTLQTYLSEYFNSGHLYTLY